LFIIGWGTSSLAANNSQTILDTVVQYGYMMAQVIYKVLLSRSEKVLRWWVLPDPDDLGGVVDAQGACLIVDQLLSEEDLVPHLRTRVSVRRGSLPTAAVPWFTVVMWHRAEGDRAAAHQLPVILGEGFAASNDQTGAAVVIGTGRSSRTFRSAREASEISKKGKPSARST
jgi:hypothetical protein